MNLASYWKGGMGLHEHQLLWLYDVLATSSLTNVVEFGSGASTQFLLDARKELNKDFRITSFDHSNEWCYVPDPEENDIEVCLRPLIQCSDDVFESCFVNRTVDRDQFEFCFHENNNFRARNTFYDIMEDDLPKDIDLVILDGPSGNGRSLAFVHLIGLLMPKCRILIDDANHYDFVDRCVRVFPTSKIIHQEHDPSIHKNYSTVLLEV